MSAPATVALSVPELVDRARRLAEPGTRRILGSPAPLGPGSRRWRGPWSTSSGHCAASWSPWTGSTCRTQYLELDEPTRLDRLVRRHERHGKTHQQAVDWAGGSDQANAVIIARGRDRAALVVTVAAP